jgi:phage gpG-like protein
MASLELTLDELVRHLGNRASILANPNLGQAWPAVGLYLQSQAQLNFAGGHSPEGAAWATLRHPSRRRGGPSAKPLRDTGILMGSMTSNGPGHVDQRTPSSLTWGTNVSYAGYHQWGTRHIPARPFLGLTGPMIERIADLVADVAARQVAG